MAISSERTNINRECVSLYLSLVNYITCSLKYGAPLEKEILWLDRRQKVSIVLGGHLTVFGITSSGDTILEEVEGFSPFMVSPLKTLYVSCLL